MTQPRTLLEMSNRVPPMPTLGQSTLLLIDLQEEYRRGPLQLAGIEDALAQAADVLARARAAGARVVHVAHAGTPGGAFDRAAERGEIAAAVAPLGGEAVVEKTLPCAFSGTDLAAALDRGGRRPLVVMGAMTHMCVSSTVRAAAELGHAVTIIADACATRDLPLPGGGIVAAADVHRAELAALGDRFARISRTVDLA
jgi:nicotinamidase-related amidase